MITARRLPREWYVCLPLLSVILFARSVRADEVDDGSAAAIMDMDLDELLKLQIRIASIDAKPVQAQPAVVAVITAKEIEAAGAKDLKDILQLVPGFTAGTDVCGVVGPGFRGLWAYEGKVQVLVDGVEMNESYFGNVFSMDQFAAANIKQVEILRGPGSAMYGGTAELAVISITSKGAELNGGVVSERLVFHGDDFGHQVTSSFGYRLKGDWSIFGNLAYGEFAPSNQKYLSPDGALERDLHGNMKTRPLELNLGVSSKETEVRVIHYRYLGQDQLFYGFASASVREGQPGENVNSISALSAKHRLRIVDGVTMTPRAIYKFEKPWYLTYNGAADAVHRHYQRLDLDAPMTVEISDSSKLLVGAHAYYEHARAFLIAGTSLNYPEQTVDNYFSGSDTIAHQDVAAYAQYDLDSRWVNLTLGGRYEYYSYSGGTFVPRVGLVKAWDRFHLKAFYNQSFRTPNIGVVTDSHIRLKNELTTTYEVEAGYRLRGGFSLTGNGYYVHVDNIIGYDPSINRYDNGDQMSTAGLELQARYNSARFASTLGYSYNRAFDQGAVLYSANPTLRHLNLNMPAHQLVGSASWRIHKGLHWNVSGTYLDRRAAYAFPDPEAPSILGAEILLHSYLGYQWQHFDFGLGVRDLLDTRERIGQPYNGGSGPLRLSGRTVFTQIGIRFHDTR